MQTGVADPNPYDGIEAGKVNLWTHDHYHASTHGSLSGSRHPGSDGGIAASLPDVAR